MSFNQMAIKIFFANFRRYLLYFLCSSFSILVFFTFMSIYTNEAFMNPANSSSFITSNIIAPGIVVVIFSVFFIFYAQGSFLKFRKREFGTFMVLGMTGQNIRKIILIENCFIAIFSLITGLITGTIFSRIFFILIMRVTDIQEISFSIAFNSYLYTIIFFALTYLLIILGSLIASLKYEIVKLIKSNRREDENFLGRPVLVIIGAILIIAAYIDMRKNFDAEHSTVLLRSMALCFIGLYLIISNMIWLLSILSKFFHNRIDNHIIFMADLKYGFGRSKKVLFLITLLSSITIFFSSLAGVLISGTLSYALDYNPYDISFTEMYGYNKISDEKLSDIISRSDTPLTCIKTLDIIATNDHLILLSDKEISNVSGNEIKVDKGKFISLFQFVKNDGYFHETVDIENIEIPSDLTGYRFVLQDTTIEMFFNNTRVASNNHYFILNDSDFNNIKINGKVNYIGSIKLLNFEDWRKTGTVLNELQREFESYNKEYFKEFDEESVSLISKPASKISDYLDKKHGGDFLLFLLSFVGILFFICSAVILHFQLLTEYESEKLKYRKMYKIGISSNEIFGFISKELSVLFFTPFIIAAFIATYYSFSLSSTIDGKNVSLAYSFIISIIYICFQFTFYLIYRISYTRKLIKNL